MWLSVALYVTSDYGRVLGILWYQGRERPLTAGGERCVTWHLAAGIPSFLSHFAFRSVKAAVLHKNYFSTAFECVLIHFATDTSTTPLTTEEHLIVNLRVQEKVRTNAHETRHNGVWCSIHHEQCQNTLKSGIISSLLSQNKPAVSCPWKENPCKNWEPPPLHQRRATWHPSPLSCRRH